jgi:hypothetical protein
MPEAKWQPGPPETVVLRRLGLVRSDELPDIAAGWLAEEGPDTEAVRLLAGHDRGDPWGLDRLLADSIREAGVAVPDATDAIERIAVDWVTATWRRSGNTRWAVMTLAGLGETYPEFDLGLFIGLDDEGSGGWGRLEPDLKTAARQELRALLRGPDVNTTGTH